jgi:hypothetical protein
MANITGGCLCGQIRYTASGDPTFAGLCHCRNCQRYTGSAFETVIAFPSSAVSVQGTLKTYNDTGDSGKAVYRRFCSNCGSGVVAEAEALAGVTLLLAGTLDDPSGFRPVMEIYCDSAQPWTKEASERKTFAKMPG